MGRTVRDALVTAMANLGRKGLKKFRNKLHDWPIRAGFTRIPRGQLEDTDDEDVADLIRKFYRDDYGTELTLAVLEAIDERTVAEELREDLENVDGFRSKERANGAAKGATSEVDPPPVPESRKHFVIEHREDLISRVYLVDPILDELLGKDLLTNEQYDTVRNKTIPQEKMRQLYCYVRAWGDTGNDKFYDALKNHNAPLIKDLEKSK